MNTDDGHHDMIATSRQQDGCRPGCGACCIAPSISSAIPGMPHGKPAGVRCIQLDDNNLCQLFGDPRRPGVCHDFTYDQEICGYSRKEALDTIALLEASSMP
ncbi:YkgJ family cysteine cluster protein [Kushneria marisflavi]|nr:YkgJ family cysteine cluster protein [Kushneria marisflavi]RKD86779.1 hypothetical protein C8D96_0229 [Kushneria marisflavi]